MLILLFYPGPVPAQLLTDDVMDRAAQLIETLLPSACQPDGLEPDALAARLPGFRGLPREVWQRRGTDVGWRGAAENDTGERVRVEYFAPGGTLRRIQIEYHDRAGPRLLAVVGPDCRIQFGRALAPASDGQGQDLLMLDGALQPTGQREPQDPPPPPGRDPGGVTVAMVDSGVNYTLPEIAPGLARSRDGQLLGYDFWDDDPRPFDANPAHSPFFPQRHGTRIASILMREAPDSRLVVYRYPRPAMERMSELVEHAADTGVRVVNLSLGSNRIEDWQAFAEAARRHPEILFIASAGNNGRDLDLEPVYPAALDLDNLITVTSGDGAGQLAEGSNWGAERVDLIVPGEQQPVLGFDGTVRSVSGSSYAAPRATALAARLLGAHPDWDSSRLKAAIFALAVPQTGDRLVAGGVITDPAVVDLGEASMRPHFVPERPDGLAPPSAESLWLDPLVVILDGAGWARERVDAILNQAADVLAQCAIVFRPSDIQWLRTPDRWLDFDWETASDLLRMLPPTAGRVVFLRDTRQQPAFGAMTLGTGNTRERPDLRHSVWVTRYTRDAGVALAHELFHLLSDHGVHVTEPDNLMQASTAPEHTRLSPNQCREARRVGVANGLLQDRVLAPQ